MPDSQNSEESPEQTRQLIRFEAAMQRLRAPADTFNALVVSGLLGDYTEEGIPVIGIENYERFGTQWRPELGERLPPNIDSAFPQGIEGVPGGSQPPNTYIQIQISPYPSPEVVESDTKWIAQFYLRPNRYFFPDLSALALVGPPYLKITHGRQVVGTKLPTYLFPDPSGSLAMVMILGPAIAGENPIEAAYDIAVPILDELSVQYDQSLPIAHSLVVGVPSGIITIDVPKHSQVKSISATDPIQFQCPYPELLDAVALYREGISSNNPFHQFLTLWKVYENATRTRGNWRRQHKKADIKIHQEVFPDVYAFELVKGRTFEKVKQDLNDAYRNAIAHGDFSGGKPRTGASVADFVEVWLKVPILRYMAHTVLENVRATLASTAPQSSVQGDGVIPEV